LGEDNPDAAAEDRNQSTRVSVLIRQAGDALLLEPREWGTSAFGFLSV
jgi:hypothetical protein